MSIFLLLKHCVFALKIIFRQYLNPVSRRGSKGSTGAARELWNDACIKSWRFWPKSVFQETDADGKNRTGFNKKSA